MKRELIWLPVLMLLLAAGVWAKNSSQTNERELTLQVTGMVCPACPPNVVRALESLEGVHSAEVDLATHQARVRFDPSRVSIEDMTQATRRAGYPSSVSE